MEPETALSALATAPRERGSGTPLAGLALRWLDRGRCGPEEVLADGNPAAVAPLARSATLVVRVLTELRD